MLFFTWIYGHLFRNYNIFYLQVATLVLVPFEVVIGCA